MLNIYGTTRSRVIKTFDALIHLAEARGIDGVRASSIDAQERLVQNRFNLVVFGEFKRGKSTFINSLLGRTILPTAVIPLTSIVTIVRYGEDDHAMLYLHDGQQRAITFAELPAYITEAGNPRNRKHVARVEVFVTSPLLKDGVQIVDTPGVGSVHEHNTEVTSEYLPNADAAIFLIAADPPISRSEREFLHEVRQYVTKIFFVQNKIDHLAADELQQSLAFNRQVIAEETGDPDVQIFPISARLALDGKLHDDATHLVASRLVAFEQALDAFLKHERGWVALQSGINAGIKAASDLRASIELEQIALTTPVAELEHKLALFNERLAGVQEQKSQDLFLLTQRLQEQVIAQLDDDLVAEHAIQRTPLQMRLTGMADEAMTGNGAGLLAQLNACLPRIVHQILYTWQADEAARLSRLLDASLQPFTDKVNGLIDQIHEISADVFAITVGYFHPDQYLAEFSGFSIHPWQIQVHFELAAMSLLYLLPARWVRRQILAAAWHRLWEQFDMHLGRLRYDFLLRMQASIRQYAKLLDAKVEDTAQGIEMAVRQAMAERERGQAAIDEAQARLAAQRASIDQVLDRLPRLQEALATYAADEGGTV